MERATLGIILQVVALILNIIIALKIAIHVGILGLVLTSIFVGLAAVVLLGKGILTKRLL